MATTTNQMTTKEMNNHKSNARADLAVMLGFAAISAALAIFTCSAMAYEPPNNGGPTTDGDRAAGTRLEESTPPKPYRGTGRRERL